jgi:hypothetical protein
MTLGKYFNKGVKALDVVTCELRTYSDVIIFDMC